MKLLLPLLTVLFVGLKLTDRIDWDWVWVLSPIWGGCVLAVLMVTIGVMCIASSLSN